jgi:hypothetical protein
MGADLFANVESEANASAVDPLGLLKLAKQFEKLWFVLCVNSISVIFHVDHYELGLTIDLELATNFDAATRPCELEGICQQVERDLLDSLRISLHLQRLT